MDGRTGGVGDGAKWTRDAGEEDTAPHPPPLPAIEPIG
jgi:hypothetical protein